MAGLLAAAVVTGVAGSRFGAETANARSKSKTKSKRKRGKRQHLQSEELVMAKGTSIPPNCIYVCCDGTCDSWKMCLRCVKWPKPTTTVAIAGG
jgi:hypothetical protein